MTIGLSKDQWLLACKSKKGGDVRIARYCPKLNYVEEARLLIWRIRDSVSNRFHDKDTRATRQNLPQRHYFLAIAAHRYPVCRDVPDAEHHRRQEQPKSRFLPPAPARFDRQQ